MRSCHHHRLWPPPRTKPHSAPPPHRDNPPSAFNAAPAPSRRPLRRRPHPITPCPLSGCSSEVDCHRLSPRLQCAHAPKPSPMPPPSVRHRPNTLTQPRRHPLYDAALAVAHAPTSPATSPPSRSSLSPPCSHRLHPPIKGHPSCPFSSSSPPPPSPTPLLLPQGRPGALAAAAITPQTRNQTHAPPQNPRGKGTGPTWAEPFLAPPFSIRHSPLPSSACRRTRAASPRHVALLPHAQLREGSYGRRPAPQP